MHAVDVLYVFGSFGADAGKAGPPRIGGRYLAQME